MKTLGEVHQVSGQPAAVEQVAGKIMAVATRTRNGAKWIEITVDIDSKGQSNYVHKCTVRDAKAFADQIGVETVRDIVGRKIVFAMESKQAAPGGHK